MGNTATSIFNNTEESTVTGGLSDDQSDDDVFYDTITEDDSVLVGVRPKYNDPQADDPVLTPPREDDQALSPPRKDDPALTPPLEDDPNLTKPQKDDPALTPPREDDPALTPPREDDPALTLPHEDDPVLTPPHKSDPAITPPHESDPSLVLPHESDPSLALPHEGDPSLALPHESDPSLALPHESDPAEPTPKEGDPVSVLPNTGHHVDTLSDKVTDIISMEWEDDMNDPFEKALAKRLQVKTTSAEYKTLKAEDEGAQASCQTMKKPDTDNGLQDSKPLQCYPDEEARQDKERYLDDNKGKDGRAPQHCTGKGEGMEARTLQLDTDLQCYADQEEKDSRTLQDYLSKEDSNNRMLQYHHPSEKEDGDVMTHEDKGFGTQHQYLYKENIKYEKTELHYPYEEERQKYRLQYHHQNEDEEERGGEAHEVEIETGKNQDHLPYEREENIKTLQQDLDEEEDKNGRARHHSSKEDKEIVRPQNRTHYEETLEHDINDYELVMLEFLIENEENVGKGLVHHREESPKNRKTRHSYLDEEEEEKVGALHSFYHEAPSCRTKKLNMYEEEDKDERGKHYPYEEEDKDERAKHYPYEEEDKSERGKHYPYEEEDKDERANHYPYEEDKDERAQKHYPYEEEDKDERAQKHYTDDDKDMALFHDSSSEEEEEERYGKTLKHYSGKLRCESGTRQDSDNEDDEDTDRALHITTDEEEEQHSRKQQNNTDENKKQEGMRLRHHSSEGRDRSMFHSDQHNQYPQEQDEAPRRVRGGYYRRGPSRSQSQPWRNRGSKREYDRYEPHWRNQQFAHRGQYPPRGRWIQRQEQNYTSGHYHRSSYNSHYSSGSSEGYTGNRGEEDDVLNPEELAVVLAGCPSFHATFINLQDYNNFNTKSVQQVAAAYPQVFRLDRNGVQLQPQIKICHAYPSPQGCPHHLSCQDLHICNIFISSWCPTKPCPLGHSLSTNHNKAVLETFCLTHLPTHLLRKLLQHIASNTPPSTSSHLDVCRYYNRGHCDRVDCQALHLCLSFVKGRGKCRQPECRLNHNPNTPDCCRLLSSHGISVNETIMDIIVALQSVIPSLTTDDDAVSSSTSQGGAKINKNTFFNRIKQTLGLNDNTSTREAGQHRNSQRNRESATSHYKSYSDSQELGAVGGQKSTKNSENYVPQRKVGKNMNPSGRTEGSQQAVWAYHQQGNVSISEICRFSVESVCMKEDKGCSRLHASVPYHWQVCNSERQESWINLPGTITTCLETAFCDPAKNGVRLPPLNLNHLRRLKSVLDQDTWYANFEAMVVTNSDYSKVATLRRLCVQAGAPAPYNKSCTYSWYFCDINGRWIKYGQVDTSGQVKRGSNITSADIETHYLARPDVPLSFKVSQYTYNINFGAMTQTNQTTKVQRAVRRRPELFTDASLQNVSTGTKATSSAHKAR